MFSSFVSAEPQYGQRNVAVWSCTSVVSPAARGAGGAKPAARSFSRPSGVMRSVDHESSWITSTSGSAPSSATFAASSSRITSSAGQPRNVGVNATWTRPSSTRTSRTTPRSTSDTTGISGSATSASASQTCASVTMPHPARSAAPSSSPPTAPATRRRGCRARPPRPPRGRRALRASGRSSASTMPSAYGKSSSTASR